MSKTLPAPRMRAPMTACGTSVPAADEVPEPIAAPQPVAPRCIGAPRQAVPRRKIRSNLGEPVGMFVWEQDFLLALAAEVLEDFVAVAPEQERKVDDEDEVEAAVLNHLAEYMFTEERCKEILRGFIEDQGILREKTAERRRLLERERDELGRRLERWYQRIETDPELEDVGAERMRELKAKRDEVIRDLGRLKPLHTLPPYLYKPETIQRFQARIREAFLSGDQTTARVYLNTLVERVSVSDDEIIIDARAGAALAMMAEPRKTHPESTGGEVLADVVGWRAPQDSNL